jgi:hypothetical protein
MFDKPSKVYNNAPRSTSSPLPIYIPDPSIRVDAFDQILQNRGIRFLHKIAAPCPNMKSLDSNNHDPFCQFCDNSQTLHLPGKEIWGVFTSNSLEKMFEVQGVWEVGTAVVSLPTEFPDGTQADFSTFDHLVCPDFLVRLTDLKEYEPTTSGKQKVRYPIVDIVYMTSVRNNLLYDYKKGVDFEITDGEIEWIPGKEPSYDDAAVVGEVISITYTANPVYAVLNVMHEMRVTQEMNSAGQKVARRMPQQVLVKRDFLVTGPDAE